MAEFEVEVGDDLKGCFGGFGEEGADYIHCLKDWRVGAK
jgi:hypothetical protein